MKSVNSIGLRSALKASLWLLVTFSQADAQVWEKVHLPFNSAWVLGESQGNVIAGGDCIYFSGDREQFKCSLPDQFFTHQMANYKGKAFVASSKGLMRSDDGGKTWAKIRSGEHTFITNVNDTLYTGRTAVWYSSDGGVSWTQLLPQSWRHYLIEQYYAFKNRFIVRMNTGDVVSIPRGGYDTTVLLYGAKCIYINESHSDRIYAGTKQSKNFCISDDGGKTWSYPDSLPGVVSDIQRNDTVVYAATDKGLYYSAADTITWHKIGALNYRTSNLVLLQKDYYIRYGGKLLRSTDGGVNWELVYKGLFNYNGWNKPIILAGNQTFNMLDVALKNVDTHTYTEGGINLAGIFSYAGEACNMIFTYSDWGQNFYSSDGITWKKYTIPSSPGAVRKVVGHRNRVYICCYNPFSEGSEKLGWSDADSIVWQDFMMPADFQFRRVSASKDLLFLQGIKNAQKVLLFSSDEGLTWTERELPAFGEIIEYNGKFFCSSTTDSYFSVDSGRTWSGQIPGLPCNRIPSIIVHKNQLYCVGLTADVKYENLRGWNIYQFNNQTQGFSDITLNLQESLPPYYPDYGGQLDWPGPNVVLYSDKRNLYLSLSRIGLYQLSKYFSIGISEELSKVEIKIYPNPTVGQLSFECGETVQKVIIRNLNGMILDTHSVNARSGLLDFPSLPPGYYILELMLKNSTATQKIIKY